MKFFSQIEEGKDNFLDASKHTGLLKACHVEKAIATLRSNNIRKTKPKQAQQVPNRDAIYELMREMSGY